MNSRSKTKTVMNPATIWRRFSHGSKLLLGGICCLLASRGFAAASWDGNRWFQIEVSIFSNEFAEDQFSERFTPDRLALAYPSRVQRLDRLITLFAMPELEDRLRGETRLPALEDTVIDPLQQLLMNTGPAPRARLLDFRLPDMERDAFVQLPPAQSDFQQTNRALERSPDNRLLFHGLWRQPVLDPRQAVAVLVEGGRRFADQYELQGSLTLRFNPGQDRVVIDSNLWLVEFQTGNNIDEQWQLPALPRALRRTPAISDGQTDASGSYHVTRIIQFQQSRDMRSNEFHYLDHPALGLVVSVKPYDLPLPLSLDSNQ